MSNDKTGNILLRIVIDSDLPIFFEQQLDPEANYMAAFGAKDPADRKIFNEKWIKIMDDDTVTIKTIIFKKEVAGHVLRHESFGDPEVSYWIGKEFWGKGIATEALSAFLNDLNQKPLYARVVKDNAASIRVLEKCGFTKHGEDKGFANARNKEVAELIMKLG